MISLLLACVLTFIVTCGYACLLYFLQINDLDRELLPFLVTVGVSILIFFFFLSDGVEQASRMLAISASGAPPVTIGYYMWRIQRRRAKRTRGGL